MYSFISSHCGLDKLTFIDKAAPIVIKVIEYVQSRIGSNFYFSSTVKDLIESRSLQCELIKMRKFIGDYHNGDIPKSSIINEQTIGKEDDYYQFHPPSDLQSQVEKIFLGEEVTQEDEEEKEEEESKNDKGEKEEKTPITVKSSGNKRKINK
jgi:hypothetical protein